MYNKNNPEHVSYYAIEDVCQRFIKLRGKGKAPSINSILNIPNWTNETVETLLNNPEVDPRAISDIYSSSWFNSVLNKHNSLQSSTKASTHNQTPTTKLTHKKRF